MKFIPRTSKPEKGNKYYTLKSNGGCSEAIKGSPTDECDALSNCVGYSYGRIAECSGRTSCDLCAPVNPNILDKHLYNGLTTGQEPKLGAMIVWDKHVENVEAIIDENTIVTSSSHYGGSAFQLNIRYKIDGTWKYKDYEFKQFIYTPYVDNELPYEQGLNYRNEIFKLNAELSNAQKLIQEQNEYICKLERNVVDLNIDNSRQNANMDALNKKVCEYTQQLQDAQDLIVEQRGKLEAMIPGDANKNGRLDWGDIIIIFRKLIGK